MANRKKKLPPEQMREYIHSLRGSLKLNTGGEPFSEWWAEHKREEMELEERTFQRLAAKGEK